MPDYYQILDLVPGATKEEIKKAYRRKVMEYHPDRNDSAEARQLFLRVKEAYEVLMGRAPRRRSSAPRGAAAGQGQTDHYAFYERVYSPAAEERRRIAKERVDWQTARRFEEFKQRQEAFQRSWQYRFFQGLGHAVRAGFVLLGLGCVEIARTILHEGKGTVSVAVSIPLVLIGVGVAYAAGQPYGKALWKKCWPKAEKKNKKASL